MAEDGRPICGLCRSRKYRDDVPVPQIGYSETVVHTFVRCKCALYLKTFRRSVLISIAQDSWEVRAVAWAINLNRPVDPLVIFAPSSIVYILDVKIRRIVGQLRGHGGVRPPPLLLLCAVLKQPPADHVHSRPSSVAVLVLHYLA